MKSTFEISVQGSMAHSVDDITIFPGGEVNIMLPKGISYCVDIIYVKAILRCSDGIMALALIKEAIDYEKCSNTRVALDIPYIPYARQDRRCNEGEALSIKVFCNMVNAMEFDQLWVTDPHSDVAPALLNNLTRVIPQYEVIQENADLYYKLKDGTITPVAPDVGASKKMEATCAKLGISSFIQGTKHRDLATGALSGFGYSGDVEGKDLVIIDDICDGGGTFLGLAKELYAGGALTVSLCVTHGIFSQGTQKLLDNGITQIYTTDSYYNFTKREPNGSVSSI